MTSPLKRITDMLDVGIFLRSQWWSRVSVSQFWKFTFSKMNGIFLSKKKIPFKLTHGLTVHLNNKVIIAFYSLKRA